MEMRREMDGIMSYTYKLTILTPAYNRKTELVRLYKSLLNQTNQNFQWLIIDDGSTDGTEELIETFTENKFVLEYYKKKNGGKHTALNYGIKRAKGDFILILDSDDFLTDDAILKANNYWDKYKDNKTICGLSFLKKHNDGSLTGKSFEGNEIVSDHISFRYNNNLLGDMEEVYRTSILKRYPFPIFDEERFLSEAIVWNKIAFDYKTVYINEAIYICEYLDDGLSKNCLRTRIKCPIGTLENAKIFLDKRFKLYIRIKNSIIYTGFSLIAHKKVKDIFNYSGHKLLVFMFLPLGVIFYLYLLLNKK